MITKEKIEEIYNNMHQSGINTDVKMLYGYFFTNTEPEKLKKVAEELKDQFEYVNIYPDDTKQYWLHMERIEIHNAKTLFELNKKLYAVAAKHKITSYDGFDIGNADKNKALENDTYAVPEAFASHSFQKESTPLLVLVNKAFKHFAHKEEFCFFLEIKIKYKAADASKLPTTEAFDELNNFELFVESNLTHNGIKNYYLGRTTHNEALTFYIVTNDKKNANGLLKFLQKDNDKIPFEFQIIEDKEWKIYAEFEEKLKTK